MDIPTIIMSVLFVTILLWAIMAYNRFVALKHNVSESWSNIDVLLKQRYEELPKLVDSCREYMTYERETLDRITKLRNDCNERLAEGDVTGLAESEGLLGGAVSGLLARAEAYPELKSSEQFQRLLARIATLQDSISDRREFYNESVNINNIRREQFPDLLIARLFGFAAFNLFEVQNVVREDMSMRELFKR